ncbi:MAG TPA: hypothetical protein VL574_07580 [Stellaceae bacterium]|nr:hypothetical protein [Stellaceae bacterium]
MSFVLLLLAGALLCNAIPHLAKGLSGEPFPTPFATPRGIGNSSPLVNVLWGCFNLAIAVLILRTHPGAFWWPALTFLISGIFLALHFGKVRKP